MRWDTSGIHSTKLFSIASVLVLVVNLFWFISGKPPLEGESAFRFILGSGLVFLLPGLIWGEILGFSSSHFLETIALSFALTLTIEVVLLPIPFLVGSKIDLWVALLICACLLGMLILNVKSRNENGQNFLSPILDFHRQPLIINISALSILLVLAIISYGTYRWGENLHDIGGEKLLHMIYIRYYYSLPMVLSDLSVFHGTPPPNLVHFWEYLLAGWASLINVDPLVLFYRARFVLPFLGFSGMYLLIRNIFSNAVKCEAIFWGVLFMCLGWFTLLSPSNLDWVKNDPFRGVMSFMGTVHHGDSAMELLVALLAGLILMSIRNLHWRNLLLLGGVLSASFMWHPREFFQSSIYIGTFGIALVLLRETGNKGVLKKWITVMAIFVVIAIGFYAVIYTIVPPASHGYDELKIKNMALKYAFSPKNLMGIRNLFNSPSALLFNNIFNRAELARTFARGWNFYLWLILSAMAIPVLSLYGEKEDKKLSLFYILLWFLVLGWNFSMLIIIVLTYSEIYIIPPRMIYIFSYIIIADAIHLTSRTLYRKKALGMHLVYFSILMFAMGLFFHLWWNAGKPFIKPLSYILSLLCLISFILVLSPRSTRTRSLGTSVFSITIVGMLVFFLPILWNEYLKIIPQIISKGKPAIDWFGKNNPFGLSSEMIYKIRSLPPKQTFLVDPLSNECISVYAPQYLAVVPKAIGAGGNVLLAKPIYNEVESGRHPIFKAPDVLRTQEYIKNRNPEFKTLFFKWEGKHTIKMTELSQKAPPLTTQWNNGDFNFKRIITDGNDVIRVYSVASSKKGERGIHIEYRTGENGFNLKVYPGDDVVFLISARLSDSPERPPALFIHDKTESWETKSVFIDKTSWDQYVISKKIRPGASVVGFGIIWQPATEHEWLEIKDVRIFIVNRSKIRKSKDEIRVDHQAAKDWLNNFRVDYLLINKEHYAPLLPYFRKFSEEYNIIFDNPSSNEMIVHYLSK